MRFFKDVHSMLILLPVMCEMALDQMTRGKRRHQRQLACHHSGAYDTRQSPRVRARVVQRRALYAKHLVKEIKEMLIIGFVWRCLRMFK